MLYMFHPGAGPAARIAPAADDWWIWAWDCWHVEAATEAVSCESAERGPLCSFTERTFTLCGDSSLTA